MGIYTGVEVSDEFQVEVVEQNTKMIEEYWSYEDEADAGWMEAGIWSQPLPVTHYVLQVTHQESVRLPVRAYIDAKTEETLYEWLNARDERFVGWRTKTSQGFARGTWADLLKFQATDEYDAKFVALEEKSGPV